VRVLGVAEDVEAGEVVELALVMSLAWGTLAEFIAARGSAASGTSGADDAADSAEGDAGGGAREASASGAPPSRAAVLRVLIGAAHGLAYLHERAIMHADLRPTNILVDARGEGMLADLGLARTRVVLDVPGASFFGARLAPMFVRRGNARGERRCAEEEGVGGESSSPQPPHPPRCPPSSATASHFLPPATSTRSR
jgi:hypothetical protein